MQGDMSLDVSIVKQSLSIAMLLVRTPHYGTKEIKKMRLCKHKQIKRGDLQKIVEELRLNNLAPKRRKKAIQIMQEWEAIEKALGV